ncbi:MAG: glycosyltransferase [Janthinobacterium lividum]
MPGEVRVQHVPGAHAYVEHLQDPRVPGVQVLPEPSAPAAGWAPSPALDADWVAAHADTFDVLHVHFGFESRSPGQLQALTAALRERGRALVVTVHDLQNPHLRDQEAYLDLLGILVRDADAVLTLTPGAAREIQRRWGVPTEVLAHPHVVPLERLEQPRPVRSGRVVGIHLKSLRANVVALPVLRRLMAATAEQSDVVLRVDVHAEALDKGFVRHDAELAKWLAGDLDLDLRVHERFDDDALWDYLAGLDVSVLPYAHGTHSGWLEACHDLGTTVLAGRAGFLTEQQPLVTVDLDDDASVRAGLATALTALPGPRASRAERSRQRHDLAAAHRDVYRRVAAARVGGEA